MRPTLDHGTGVWRAFELRWPRRRYRILDFERERKAWLAERARLRALLEAQTGSVDRNSQKEETVTTRQLSVIDSNFAQIDSFVGEVITELPRRRIEGPFLDAPSGPEWTLERFEGPTAHQGLFELDPFSREAKTRAAIYRVALPPGGLFFPPGNGGGMESTYDPLGREGDDIFLDVQAIQFDDGQALVRFVNIWGILGVGIPAAPDCRLDGVQLTGRCLAKLSTWFKTIHQLQRRRRSTELTREQITDQLLAELKKPLGSQSAIDYIATGRFNLRTLWDGLCLKLWEHLNGHLHLRHCANDRCRRIFVPRRNNQRFCARTCANRWTVRNWKRRHRSNAHALGKRRPLTK